MAQPWINSGTDCCSPFETCCLTYFCPCITYGRVHHRLTKDVGLNGYSACNGSCCGYAALAFCGFAWVMQMMQRGDVRHRYNLDGNGCTDCLCAYCCHCCDLVQQDKEVKDRETKGAGMGPPGGVMQQPDMYQGMQYAPQQQGHIPSEHGYGAKPPVMH